MNQDILHDHEAEQFVLGVMMVDKDTIPTVLKSLGRNADVFHTVQHSCIYLAILDVYDRIAQSDVLLVADQLKSTDQLNRVGGTTYLYELQSPIVETESIEFYAKILSEKAIRRRLIAASHKITEAAKDENLDTAETVNMSQEMIFDVAFAGQESGFTNIREVLVDAIDRTEQLYNKEDRHLGVATGFMAFDEMTSGFQQGNLIIIAARPSVGKTTLALNMAYYIARNQEKPVAFFSLEMPAKDLTMRMLAAESGIDFQGLRTGNFPEDCWAPIFKAHEELMKAKMHICDDGRANIQDLRAETRRLSKEHGGLSALFVDYLQLMRSNEQRRYSTREQEVSLLSRELKALALELDIPVIACAQLSREVERRPGKEPQLSDLRESGAIEQDADLVAFLHREEQKTSDGYIPDPTEEIYLLIKKQRNGPTGTLTLTFDKQTLQFRGE